MMQKFAVTRFRLTLVLTVFTRGVYCIDAPVFDRAGYPVACVWTTGLMMDLERQRIPEIGATVRTHADRISARLGFDRGSKPLEVAECER